MDRFCWVTANEHFLGENVIAQQSGVRLYNGEDRTMYDEGSLQLTTHRIIWDDASNEGNTVAVDLSLIIKTEDVAAQFRKSAKIVLYLAQAKSSKPEGPTLAKKADFVKLSFRKGGKDEFHSELKKALEQKSWDKVKPPPATNKAVSCYSYSWLVVWYRGAH